MKPLRILLGSLVIAILLVSALALPVWYVYSQGTRFVRESESEARNRSVEMAVTLNTLSGESLYYDNLIALSHTMDMIVRQSRTRKDAFEIEEAFLVDKNGKLLAHSDISKVAAEAQVSYDGERLHFRDIRFKGDPVGIEVTERVTVEFGGLAKKAGLEPLLSAALRLLLPDLAASRYHVYGSVYMPDEDLPAGTLHIMVHNHNADAVVAQFAGTVFQIASISFAGAAGLWLVFTILLAVMVVTGPERSAPRGAPHQGGAEGEQRSEEADLLNEAELEPLTGSNVARIDDYRNRKKGMEPGEQTGDEALEESRILDAIPLDRI